jgi:dTMP kinase
MTRGKFIVIEGGDGAGKDTQIDLLKGNLPEEKFLFVRDPGSTEIGLALREIVLHNKQVSRPAELLMYLASRVQLAEEKIKPALERGIHVISNRFDLSTIAYQIYGRERHDLLEFVKQLSNFALGGLRPDLVILLDCPPSVGLARIAEKEHDRFESEKLAFHERVYEGYRKHIGDYSHKSIDATRTPEDVHKEVLEAVTKLTR